MKNYVFLLLAICFMCSCESVDSQDEASSKSVVATTQMIADMARNIAGENVTVRSLMGPGVDPHFYKATQGDLKALQDADLILYNGLHLEGKMQDVFENLAQSKAVKAVSSDLDKAALFLVNTDGKEKTYDPHIWHHVSLWSACVATVEKALVASFPEHKDEFEVNAKQYFAKLQALDSSVKLELASIPANNRLMVTSHDAFNYFGKAYDIEVKGLQGISTVTEVGLKDRINMVKLLVDRKVPAVFVESSVSKKQIEAVMESCKNKGHIVKNGGTLYSDAMGADGSEEGTYIGMIQANVRTLVNALK